jgi:hypothetical protein
MHHPKNLVLDGMKLNPTAGQGFGFIFFSLTHPDLRRSVFFSFSCPLPTDPLPFAFPFLFPFFFPLIIFFSFFGTFSLFFLWFPFSFVVYSFYFWNFVWLCLRSLWFFCFFILCFYLRFLLSLCFFCGFFPIFFMCATYCWKILDKGYNFVWDLISIKGLYTKVWTSKIVGVLTLGILVFPFGKPKIKWHLGASPMARHKVYYKEEGGSFF